MRRGGIRLSYSLAAGTLERVSAGIPYFAFGANTCADVLARRRIVPVSSQAAVLPDHRLAFVLRGVPWIEPAFASVVPEPGAAVHGVLHVIGERELRRLDRAESPGYERREAVVTTRGGERVAAQMYVATRPKLGLRPSRRYRDLIVRGAREFDLPASWIAELEKVECTHVPFVSDLVPALIDLLEGPWRKR
jgi:gamma-glutamylcyclotransferase (GGCT)/AIG2-like uncharacterized protein YtfP